MSIERKKRVFLTANAKEIILRVIEICEFEKAKDGLIKPLTEVITRASILTGVDEETIRNILIDNWKPKDEEPKKKPKVKANFNRKTVLSDRDIIKIKNMIRTFHVKHCKAPSTKEILDRVSEQVPIGQDVKFTHILSTIGYRRKKITAKKVMWIEDQAFVTSRDEYLKRIREVRNENIYYVNESIINRFHTLYKSWFLKYGNNEALDDKHTYTVICAASINGFLKPATAISKTVINETLTSFRGQLTANIFETWLKNTLIPCIPRNSIVVVDNAPHHSAMINKPLSYFASKQEMLDFLKEKKIVWDKSMRKGDLHQLVQENTQDCNVFVVDDMLKQHDHECLRLPHYMIDLNPTQLAMDHIQAFLHDHSDPENFNAEAIGDTLQSAMELLTKDDWRQFFQKARCLEDDYWREDDAFEEVYDKIVINMRACVDSPSDSSTENSEEED